MHLNRPSRCGLAAATAGAALAAVAFSAAPASAHPAKPHHPQHDLHVVKTLASNYVGPLQFAVSGRHVFVADAFTSTLTMIGQDAPIAVGPDPAQGGDLAAVAVDPRTGALAYASSNGDHSKTTLTITRPGHRTVVADLSAFERKHNPDGRTQYGVRNPSQCVQDAFAAMGVPATYRGTVDSHPYAVTALGGGSWAVADAGGNDVLKVDSRGRVSLIAVLPSQPLTVTAEFAAASGLPACTVGITYNFEAVPTDVETGRHGALYVSTLPGGPEGPGGLSGSVYTIDRWAHPHRLATGFAGATNLAVDAKGEVYVAELWAGRLSTIRHGQPQPVLDLPGIVAVEYANGHLYASTAPAVTGADGPGTVVLLGR